jgi:hypothetical protein
MGLKSNYIKFLFTLSLLNSFNEFFDAYNNTVPTLDILDNVFKRLYANLGFGSNYRFLDRDLRNIKKYSSKIEINKSQTLSDLIKQNNIKIEVPDVQKIFTDEKRNFFAHSGLLGDFIKIKKNKQQKLEIYYIKEHLNKIKSWLLDPEK